MENHFCLIKAVFNAAGEDQLIAASPCRKIPPQPVAPSRVVPLSVDQAERLVAATPQHFRAMGVAVERSVVLTAECVASASSR